MDFYGKMVYNVDDCMYKMRVLCLFGNITTYKRVNINTIE